MISSRKDIGNRGISVIVLRIIDYYTGACDYIQCVGRGARVHTVSKNIQCLLFFFYLYVCPVLQLMTLLVLWPALPAEAVNNLLSLPAVPSFYTHQTPPSLPLNVYRIVRDTPSGSASLCNNYFPPLLMHVLLRTVRCRLGLD